MSASFYIGMTTLQAAVVAIFSAALFVLLQTATDLFSPYSHQLILKKRLPKISAATSFLLLVVGLLICARTSFPDVEILHGDQHSEFLINQVWPAILFVSGIGVSIALNVTALYGLVGDFRGPGMITALEKSALGAPIRDWLDYRNPKPINLYERIIEAARDPLRQNESPLGDSQDAQREEVESKNDTSNDETAFAKVIEPHAKEEDRQGRKQECLRVEVLRGELSDPLGPLFEVAAYSLETRRYGLVEAALLAVQRIILTWLSTTDETDRVMILYTSHMGDLLDIAAHTGSHSQLRTIIASLEGTATDLLRKPEPPFHQAAMGLGAEITLWARRLPNSVPDSITSNIVQSIAKIAALAFEQNDLKSFDETVLNLARVAEALSERSQVRHGLRVLPGSSYAREIQPAEALQDEMYRLTGLYTSNGKSLRSYPLLLSDAIYVCALSFLEVDAIDESAEHFCRSFFDMLSDIALVASKTNQTDALFKIMRDLRLLAEEKSFQSSQDLRAAFAWRSLELGMVVEAHQKSIKKRPTYRTYLPEMAASLCALCSFEELQSAIGDLYDRGVMMETPMDDQESFVRRVESIMEVHFDRFPS